MGEVGESSEKPDEGWSQYHRMILPRSANESFSYHHFKGGINVTNATNLLSFVLRRFSGETPPGAKSEPFAGLIPAIHWQDIYGPDQGSVLRNSSYCYGL
jgi:hypothetical protein